MIEKMLAAFDRLHPLSEAMRERLSVIAQIKSYNKNDVLLKEGDVANHACFVLKGLARAYYVTEGRTVTSRFMDEGFMITSWISFYTRKPGYEYIEMLEDSVLACMHYDAIQALYIDFPAFNTMGRKLTEHYFFLAEQRTQMLRKHTAEEKYQFFLQQHPDLLQRVPQKHIATYLGMSEETISRVRGKLARSKG